MKNSLFFFFESFFLFFWATSKTDYMNKRIQKSNSLHTLFSESIGVFRKYTLSLSRVRPNKYGVIFLFRSQKDSHRRSSGYITSGLQVLFGFHSEPATKRIPPIAEFYSVSFFFYHVGGTQIGTLLDPDQDHSSIRTSQQIRQREDMVILGCV